MVAIKQLGVMSGLLIVALGCSAAGDDDDDDVGASGSGGVTAGMSSGGQTAAAGSGGSTMVGGSGGTTIAGSGGTTVAGSGGTSAGSGGASAGSGGSTVVPIIDAGMTAEELGEIPEDPGEMGPWPVGVQTVHLDLGNANSTLVEIWYPAVPGSEKGQTKVAYDLRDFLPPEGKAAVPDEAATDAACECYRGLPPDAEHGPYPVSIYVHGTGAFRVTSLAQMFHWASRGFVVVAMDHPGMDLWDTFGVGTCSNSGIGQDNAHIRDVPAEMTMLANPTGEWAFLDGIVQADNVSVSGHSQGGGYAADASELAGVKMVQIWDAADAVGASDNLKGLLFIGGQSDKIIYYSQQKTGYNTSSARPKRLFGILDTGHLGVTSLCGGKNAMGEDAIDVGNHYGVCPIGIQLGNFLWDCSGKATANGETYIAQEVGDHIVNTVTTAALEETLKGMDRATQWADIKAKTEWGELIEAQ